MPNPRKSWILAVALLAAVAVPTESAWAIKNRTIILRATGSGAILGLGAGLVSYPFAKSTGTIIAGVFVGALLGTVYGFHLAEEHDKGARLGLMDGRRLDVYADLYASNEVRNAILRREKPSKAEWVLPFSVFEF